MKKILVCIYISICLFGYFVIDKTPGNKNYYVVSIVNNLVEDEIIDDIINSSIKANVMIESYAYNSFLGIDSEQINQTGSGVIINLIDREYYVLTNAHVVNFNSTKENYMYEIIDYRGIKYHGRIEKIDLESDLALLKFTKKEDLDIVKISCEEVESADVVIAIGSPLAVSNCISVGQVMKLKTINDATYPVIEHSAFINRGNSGGMLINTNNELVGLNTWGSYDQSGNWRYSLSIPCEIIIRFLNKNLKIYKFFNSYTLE